MQGEYQEEEEGKERGRKAALKAWKGAGKELGKVTVQPGSPKPDTDGSLEKQYARRELMRYREFKTK